LYYHKNLKAYELFKDSGVLFQLNLLSSVGYYGPSVAKAADYLLKNDFIDYVGSDVHHQKHVSSFESKIVIPSEIKLCEALKNNTAFK